MRQASATVLGGFALESDAKIVRHPERYMDARGVKMWNKAGAVGLALWFLVGVQKSRTIKLTGEVERRPGARAVVTILEA
ncbi:MAG: hypothetical protein ACYC2E_11730 [Sulfuricella sp.]